MSQRNFSHEMGSMRLFPLAISLTAFPAQSYIHTVNQNSFFFLKSHKHCSKEAEGKLFGSKVIKMQRAQESNKKTFAHLRASVPPFNPPAPCRSTCVPTNRGPFRVCVQDKQHKEHELWKSGTPCQAGGKRSSAPERRLTLSLAARGPDPGRGSQH